MKNEFVTRFSYGFGLRSRMSQKFEGIELTHPMGWMRWNRFLCDIKEHLIHEIGDAMALTGMRNAGDSRNAQKPLESLVMCTCWFSRRLGKCNIHFP